MTPETLSTCNAQRLKALKIKGTLLLVPPSGKQCEEYDCDKFLADFYKYHDLMVGSDGSNSRI